MATKEKIQNKPIINIIETNLREYALYVAEDRAIPKVYDGLKPVQRRLIYAAYHLGLKPTGKFRKAKALTGHTQGKFHPLGDSAIEEALVKLNQEFSTRYVPFAKKGNWGSVNGDPAAARRYIETKLSEFGWQLFSDIEYVPYVDNYDSTEQEPTVLPTPIPILLLNGYSGIAVGIAGSIPPHNLEEISLATIEVIRNPEVELKALLKIIKGPDYPTGGILTNPEALKDLYQTGKGTLYYNARYSYEDIKGETCLVVTEFPPTTCGDSWKTSSKIKALVEERKITVEDFSEENIRIVVKADDPQVLANSVEPLLCGYSVSYDFNVFDDLAKIEGGEQGGARIYKLNLIEIIKRWIRFRRGIIKKRLQDWIAKTKWEIEKVDAILILIAHRKDIKKLFDGTREDAIIWLKGIGLNEKQAEYILQSQVQSLIRQNEPDLKSKLKAFKEELASYEKDLKNISGVIIRELEEFTEQFKDERKTSRLGKDYQQAQVELGVDSYYSIWLKENGQLKVGSEFKTFKNSDDLWWTGAWAQKFFSVVHNNGRLEQYFTFDAPGFSSIKEPTPVGLLSDLDPYILIVSEDDCLALIDHKEQETVISRIYRGKVSVACGIRKGDVVILRYTNLEHSFLPFSWLKKERYSPTLQDYGWSHQLDKKNPTTEIIVLREGHTLLSGRGEKLTIGDDFLTTKGEEEKIIPGWKYRKETLHTVAPEVNIIVGRDGTYTVTEEPITKVNFRSIIPLE